VRTSGLSYIRMFFDYKPNTIRHQELERLPAAVMIWRKMLQMPTPRFFATKTYCQDPIYNSNCIPKIWLDIKNNGAVKRNKSALSMLWAQITLVAEVVCGKSSKKQRRVEIYKVFHSLQKTCLKLVWEATCRFIGLF